MCVFLTAAVQTGWGDGGGGGGRGGACGVGRGEVPAGWAPSGSRRDSPAGGSPDPQTGGQRPHHFRLSGT